MEAEQKNRSCKWCGEEVPVSNLKYFDTCTSLILVCEGCYDDLKSEYGIVGDVD